MRIPFEETRRLIDISPPLSARSAVFPGDTPLTQAVICRKADGQSVNLSTLTTTVHAGAHADAPWHYHDVGLTMDQVDLRPYIGPCYVLTVLNKPTIAISDCAAALDARATRILFRTLSQPDPYYFNKDFTSVGYETILALHRCGVVLLGIDTASIDTADSTSLPAHQALVTTGIRNLENLWLQDVEDGVYELIALPLKLVGFDGSPIRAILRSY